MNICRYIGSIRNYNSILVRYSHSSRDLFAKMTRKPMLPGVISHRSWQDSQMVSCIFRRQLHIKEGKKNLFIGRHKLDKVPPHFSIVYNSTLGSWFAMFRVGMGTISIMLAAVFYDIAPEISKDFFQSSKGLFLLGCTLFLALIVATFTVLARRVFTRIYYHADSGNFIGVRRDLFCRLKQLKYTINDVKPSMPKDMKSGDVSESILVHIKGQKFQLQGQHFVSPVIYNMHLGGLSIDSELTRHPTF